MRATAKRMVRQNLTVMEANAYLTRSNGEFWLCDVGTALRSGLDGRYQASEPFLLTGSAGGAVALAATGRKLAGERLMLFLVM